MKTLVRTLLAAGLLAWVFPASADVISFVVDTDDNDCAGYYSNPNGFSSCIIFAEDLGQGDGDISSVIAKWENEENDWEVSSFYPTFNTDWVDTSGIENDDGFGTFTYSGPAELIRFWVAKGGKEPFRVFYETDVAGCIDGTTAASDFACMTTANYIDMDTTWEWRTANGQGLSHLTFYDSEVREMSEPGTLALFGIGLIALGALRRRRTT